MTTTLNWRLRRLAAALFVVTAGLFVIGVTVEHKRHEETTEAGGSNDEIDGGGHEGEELGAPDLRIWGAFVLGIVLGLVPAVGIALATAGSTGA